MSIYIHIPFCKTICTYCDFCKMYYNKEFAVKYLDALEKEIKNKYKNELINTIYIGGGTPSVLDIDDINKLFSIIKLFNLNKEIEFTFECNIENINKDKLELLFLNGVNRLSIGVQTFNEKHLEFLNRNHTKEMIKEKIDSAKKLGFKNISIDLIYAIKDETINELENDINEYLKLDINHISTYSLIIEENTKLFIDKIKNIDEDLDNEMYQIIKKRLKDNGYIHYETSNFAKEGYQSKHNLVYWNNENYYGFGLGASGYINDVRYTNTRSINKYILGNYLLEEKKLSKEEKMSEEMILGLRKTNGVNKQVFFNKYNVEIEEVYNIKRLLEEKKMIDDGKNIYISDEYLYLANNILIEFI